MSNEQINVVRRRRRRAPSVAGAPAHARVPSPAQPVSPGRARAEKWSVKWNDIVGHLPAHINRNQISMISIGGAVGTGLFLGIGNALYHGGPLGLILGYTVMGSVVYCTVISFGEMIAYQPQIGGAVGLANMYCDEALGFALGWNAWFNWTIVLPAEISAGVVLMSYWSLPVSNTVITLLVMFTAFFLNCIGTTFYGRIESVFTSVKVLTIGSLIILAVYIDLGGSSQGFIGGKYINEFGLFNGTMYGGGPVAQFLGFVSVLIQAAFSFFGTEVPAIAAGEVINARTNIPSAINSIWIKICLFYVLGAVVVALLVPYNDLQLTDDSLTLKSPFVIALSAYPGLQNLYNALFVFAAWSAASTDFYMSSRFMFNLARAGQAPKVLGWILRPFGEGDDRLASPFPGIGIALIFSFLALMPLGSSTSQDIFGWLSAMTSASALMAWIGILFTYTRWHRGTRLAAKQGFDLKLLNRSWFQPAAAYYALIMCTLVLLFSGWAVFAGGWRFALKPGDAWPVQQADPTLKSPVASFITSYLPLPLFLFLLFGYKLIYQTKMVPVSDMPDILQSEHFGGPAEVPEHALDYSTYILPIRALLTVWFWIS